MVLYDFFGLMVSEGSCKFMLARTVLFGIEWVVMSLEVKSPCPGITWSMDVRSWSLVRCCVVIVVVACCIGSGGAPFCLCIMNSDSQSITLFNYC